MKKIILATFLFSASLLSANAQTIPSTRTTDWSHPGYPDSIPSPSLIFDVMNFGAAGDGIADDANAIRDAIDSLHGSRGVVFFPPGNYLIASTVDLPDSVILRGSGDSTLIIFDFAGAPGNGFSIQAGTTGSFANVTGGADRNSSAIATDSSSQFSAGDYAELIETNGTWDTQPISWADNSVGQILKITSVSGDTLFFEKPLRLSYDSTLNPRIQKFTPRKEVGIECMKMTRRDSLAPGVCINIYFNHAANCWVRGVESYKSIGSHIEADASTNITISGCYVHQSYVYDGTSTHGYGITLFAHTGQCLVENNIMQHLRHAFSFQTGANGNVVAYNYSFEPTRTEFPSNAGGDISLHGHYPYANLFEGNIIQNIHIDQTWGPTGPFNTFFRNRAELYGILMTVASDSLNFVGNEVPNTGALMGNYVLSGTGHFEFGNMVRGVLTPAGTTPLNDSSYYLSTRPSFWTGTFPSIGIPNTGSGSIPARDRFLSGSNFIVCHDEIINRVEELNDVAVNVYPNPASKNITISLPSKINGSMIVRLKDINGKIISEKIFANSAIENNLTLNVSNGFYLLEIKVGDREITKKISVLN